MRRAAAGSARPRPARCCPVHVELVRPAARAAAGFLASVIGDGISRTALSGRIQSFAKPRRRPETVVGAWSAGCLRSRRGVRGPRCLDTRNESVPSCAPTAPAAITRAASTPDMRPPVMISGTQRCAASSSASRRAVRIVGRSNPGDRQPIPWSTMKSMPASAQASASVTVVAQASSVVPDASDDHLICVRQSEVEAYDLRRPATLPATHRFRQSSRMALQMRRGVVPRSVKAGSRAVSQALRCITECGAWQNVPCHGRCGPRRVAAMASSAAADSAPSAIDPAPGFADGGGEGRYTPAIGAWMIGIRASVRPSRW